MLKLPNPRIFGLLLLFVGALIFGSIGWSIDVRRSTSVIQQVANETKSRLNAEISRLQFFPKILASDVRVVATLHQKDFTQAQDLLDLVAEQTGAERVFVLDRLGRAVLSSPMNEEFIGTSHRRRPFFEEAVSNEFGSFLGTDPLTNKQSYYLASEVLDLESGAFLGAVAVQVNLDRRQTVWQPSDFGFIVLDEFSVVGVSSDPAHNLSAWHPLNEEGQRTASSQLRYPGPVTTTWQHKAGSSQFGGTSYDIVTKTLSAEPWTLAILQPSTQTRLSHLYATAFGVLVFLALFLTAAYLRQQRLFALDLARKVSEKSEELEAAQSALVSRETLTALGRISAAISHEISQPIASLRFDLRTLQRAVEGQDTLKANSLLSTCRATLARAARILESLSLFARRHEADKSLIHIAQVFDDALNHVYQERPKSAGIISVENADHDAQILASNVLLGQVLINLLTNALSAVRDVKNPKIILGLRVFGPGVEIHVSDNGLGLNAKQARGIFEPFQSGKPLGEGMGIGLHLSKTIIEDMGGKISVETNLQKPGCRFVLSLPLAEV